MPSWRARMWNHLICGLLAELADTYNEANDRQVTLSFAEVRNGRVMGRELPLGQVSQSDRRVDLLRGRADPDSGAARASTWQVQPGLTVEDDGPGIPEEISKPSSNASTRNAPKVRHLVRIPGWAWRSPGRS